VRDVGPPGKDAQRRRARREDERRERERRTRERCGPDLGELEPCGWCGRDLCCPATCPADPETRLAVTVRAQTLLLLQRSVADERAHFELLCATERRRHGNRPHRLRGWPDQARDTAEWRRWHQTVEVLRDYVALDRSRALAARAELRATQVREETALEDDLRGLRARRAGAAALDERRQAWNERRCELLDLRDAMWNALGFPHLGEAIWATTTRYRSIKGQPAEELVYDGPALYEASYSILGDQHTIVVPDGDQPGLQFVIHAHWNDLRLSDRPAPPPCEPRFPTTADIPAAA
jgi:hypothetical protein